MERQENCMIEVNGHTYRLCLLDTNAVSEVVKRPDLGVQAILERFLPTEYLPCVSVFTVHELRRRSDVYEAFLELLSALPCMFLKGYEQLFQEEAELYPNPASIDPSLLSPYQIDLPPGMTRRGALAHIFSTAQFRRGERKWRRGQASILDGMLRHVRNFPPDRSGHYTPRMIAEFVRRVSASQIAMRAPRFLDSRGLTEDTVDVAAFPSVKMMTYTVFYKFYPDRRKASDSDVFDIIMSAALPYVDAVVTERHQLEVLRKTKRQDPFVAHVAGFSLAQLGMAREPGSEAPSS
jgi:hypothetical protein